MDPGKSEYYEFLDLSDINEDERRQLSQTLFSPSTPEFLQLPWNSARAADAWQVEYNNEEELVSNGPLDPLVTGTTNQMVPSRTVPTVAQHPTASVTMYSQVPPPTAYSVPPPSSAYQHPLPQNVFVSNVTANVNVHGYVTGHHYVQPQQQHYNLGEPPAELPGRGHRGRVRGRGNKRNECRVDNNLVETSSAPGYSPQFVPFPYHHPSAYYPQSVGSPMQHPNAQHATGTPLYIAPVYHQPLYNTYHHHGQYYPPQQGTPHVNPVVDDAGGPEIMQQLPVTTQQPIPQQESPIVFQSQTSEEDYESTNKIATTVIVNSNIEPVSCDVNKPVTTLNIMNNTTPATYINNHVIPDTKPAVQSQQIKHPFPAPNVITVTPNTSSAETHTTEQLATDIAKPRTTINKNSNHVVEPTMKPVKSKPINRVLVIVSEVDPDTVNITKFDQPELKQKTNDPLKFKLKRPTDQPDTTVITPESDSAETQQQQQTPPPAVQVTSGGGKSWASLFNKGNPVGTAARTNNELTESTPPITNEIVKPTTKPLAFVSPFPKATSEEKQENSEADPPEARSPQSMASYSNDPVSHRIGELLVKYKLDSRTVSLQPRGLTNRSNYCYINSILQALLACPPFYNLLKSLSHHQRKIGATSPTPILDSLVDFINEFTPLAPESRLNRKEKGQRKDMDVVCGTSFEPSRIYKILNGIRTDTFIVEGRQEDAEEFFGCILNGLNDEMLELMKLVDEGQGGQQPLSNGEVTSNGESHEQDESEWKVMGPKNKGSITRRADFGRTPISDIFRGQLRSRVHRTGDQVTDNVQPFFTLQLDIEKASNVYEALEMLVNKDKLEGVTCSRTNKQVEAWQQVTLEELPLVMVLHLKCFHYKLDTCSKIIKALEFPIDLKIDSKLLSSKVKYSGKQKQYKLFAVVYHDGKEATKGHYLTDAYHVGYGGWVRYDDAAVKSVQESHVLHPHTARVPYLLFYRRCDTVGNQQQNPISSSSSSTKKDFSAIMMNKLKI
ncbi:Ubiquitin specific protease 10 [Carabus blaptoides fortunei]